MCVADLVIGRVQLLADREKRSASCSALTGFSPVPGGSSCGTVYRPLAVDLCVPAKRGYFKYSAANDQALGSTSRISVTKFVIDRGSLTFKQTRCRVSRSEKSPILTPIC